MVARRRHHARRHGPRLACRRAGGTSRIIVRRNKDDLQVVAIGVSTRAIKSTEQQQPNTKGDRERVDRFRRIVRQQTVLIGTFLLALSVILSGCSGSVTQEEKKEKMKMLKKKEETDKVEKTEK